MKVKCEYVEKCKDYGRECSRCKHNKYKKKSYFEPADIFKDSDGPYRTPNYTDKIPEWTPIITCNVGSDSKTSNNKCSWCNGRGWASLFLTPCPCCGCVDATGSVDQILACYG